MSIWECPEHGLYGGDVFCPMCGETGGYVTVPPVEPPEDGAQPTPKEPT